jgi:glycerophosphoryl diester phosphodiesterase
MSTTIQTWGHRGCRGIGNPPENSLDAFQAAIDQGADGVELDVFLSRDDQLIVFHDDTLDRMTSGTGETTSYTLAELQQFRLKSADGSLTDARIPTLDEVLDLVQCFRREKTDSQRAQRFVVNVEIKEMLGKDIASAVAQALQPRLQNGWRVKNFQISSFDWKSLRQMKDAAPDLPRGALVHGGQEPWDISPSQLADRLAELGDLSPQTVNLTFRSLSPETAKLIRSAGAEPLVWTCREVNCDDIPRIDRKLIAKSLVDNRVTAIITDFPGPTKRLLGDHVDGR